MSERFQTLPGFETTYEEEWEEGESLLGRIVDDNETETEEENSR